MIKEDTHMTASEQVYNLWDDDQEGSDEDSSGEGATVVEDVAHTRQFHEFERQRQLEGKETIKDMMARAARGERHEHGASKDDDQWHVVTPIRGRRAAWKHHGGGSEHVAESDGIL